MSITETKRNAPCYATFKRSWSEGYLENTNLGYRPKTEILQSMLPKWAQIDL